MALFLFADNASSVLASAISSTATVIDLSPGTGALFPNPAAGQQFTLTLNDAATGLVYEIVYCTARSTDTLTVVRGQEGTAAVSWLANDRAFLAVTAGALASLAPLASPALTGIPTVPTAVGGTNTTQAASTAFVAANFAALAGNSAQQFSVAAGTVDTQAAALAQVFGWKAGTLSGNHTIAAADGGTIFAVTSASAVVTLPAASTLTNQTGGVIAEAACTVTLSSGTLEGGALQGMTSVSLGVGDFLYWQAGASNWRVLGASPDLISPHGAQLFTSSETFTAPFTGVYEVWVWGGGAGGSYGTGSSGAGGGFAWGRVSLTIGQRVAVTVGGGGAPSASNAGPSGAGGNSSFGSFFTATGATASAVVPGTPGTGSGGILNITGGSGWDLDGSTAYSTAGGMGAMGGAGGNATSGAEAAQIPGGGGGASTYTASAGAQGLVLVRW